MAVTVRGEAILQFGTTTITGFVVSSRERSKEVESYQVADEVGAIITDITGTAAGGEMGFKTGENYMFIPKSGTAEPVPGAVFTGASSEKGIVRRVRRIEQQKMPVMFALEVESYPLIALS